MVCVRAINAVATAVAAGLFLALLAVITGLGTIMAFAVGLPAIVTLMTYNGGAISAIDLQQGAPGWIMAHYHNRKTLQGAYELLTR